MLLPVLYGPALTSGPPLNIMTKQHCRTELSSESDVCEVMTGLKLVGVKGLTFFLMALICSKALNAGKNHHKDSDVHKSRKDRLYKSSPVLTYAVCRWGSSWPGNAECLRRRYTDTGVYTAE